MQNHYEWKKKIFIIITMINYAQYAHSVHHHTEPNRPYYHLLKLARSRPVYNFRFSYSLTYYFVIKIIEAHTFFILKMAKTNENRHINADGGQFFNSNF